MSAAWGESAAPIGDEWVPNGPVTVTNGVTVMLNNDVFRQLTHHPVVVRAIEARAQRICEVANSMAQMKGAKYVYTLQNNPNTQRARCRVKPGNMAAIIDDNYYGTLLKALNSVGSDPKPGDHGNSGNGDSSESSDSGDHNSHPVEETEETEEAQAAEGDLAGDIGTAIELL